VNRQFAIQRRILGEKRGYKMEQKEKDWLKKHFIDGVLPPFSFIYDETPSSVFLCNWQKSYKTERLDGKTKHILTYTDPKTGLIAKCICEVFDDFPAIEWVVKLKNNGKENSPIIENIQALDVTLDCKNDDELVVHSAKGSFASREDFAPIDFSLPPNTEIQFAPVGGRSSNTSAFPFFNIDFSGEGIMVGIGWSGQWRAFIQRDGETELMVQAGMELTHLKLYPGEEIRTPRILFLFWRGDDKMSGHNLLRRFILAHHTLQKDGKPIIGPLACNGGPQMFEESNKATEHNQIALAERYRQFGLDTEYWWIDAGWFEGRWANGVGNWFIRKDGFPNGLKPVSSALKKMDMGFILWFEPERVYQDTWLDREHPDWVLNLPNNPNRLLDLGNDEARNWLTEHISKMLKEEGIDIYRQDFNMDPLDYWRANDESERQGITEIRHIEGLYAFWDELLKRHPGLIIDNCASGGRRIDLETTSRSIPLWRTDYQYFEPNGYQCHTYGLNFYLPLSGTGSGYPDVYSFRSSMNSALVLGWNLYMPDFPFEQARSLIAEFKRLRPLFLGDFYPLTEHSIQDDVWMAYQFHREDLEEGMILAFRRKDNPSPTIHLKLRGLSPSCSYELTFEDSGIKKCETGERLSKKGIELTLEDAPLSGLITYCQK